MWTYWWHLKKWQKVHVRLIFFSQEDQNKFKRGNKNKSFRAMPSLLNMVGKWFTSIAYTPPPIDQCVKVKSRSIQLRGIYYGLPSPPKGINCCFWTKKENFYFTSRCQFHQHFTSSFFVKKLICSAYFTYSLAL